MFRISFNITQMFPKKIWKSFDKVKTFKYQNNKLNQEGSLTRFIDLRKDLQEAGHANIENCFLVNNGICTKVCIFNY